VPTTITRQFPSVSEIEAEFNVIQGRKGGRSPRYGDRERKITQHTTKWLLLFGDGYTDRNSAEADCKRYLRSTFGPIQAWLIKTIISIILQIIFDRYFSTTEQVHRRG
jgi:hypothetical protein